MNKILTKEVSFELAKFLKEIGYKEICTHIYDSDGKYYKPMISGSAVMFSNLLNLDTTQYAAPTIAEVLDWVYEKHKIWIECLHRGDFGDFTFKNSELKNNWKNKPHYIHNKGFRTPTEAYEHAIRFIYENKIR